MANEIMEAETQSLANFIQVASAGTNMAIRQAEAERLANMAKQQAQQFQATEERMQSTTVMQGLLALLGMKSEEKVAAIRARSGSGLDDLFDFFKLQFQINNRKQDLLSNALNNKPPNLNPYLDKQTTKIVNYEKFPTDQNHAMAIGSYQDIAGLPVGDSQGLYEFNNVWGEYRGGRGLGTVVAGTARIVGPAYGSQTRKVSNAIKVDYAKLKDPRTGKIVLDGKAFLSDIFREDTELSETMLRDDWGVIDMSEGMKASSYDMIKRIAKQSLLKLKSNLEGRENLSQEEQDQLDLLRSLNGNYEKAASEFAEAQIVDDKSQITGEVGAVTSLLAKNGVVFSPYPIISQAEKNYVESVGLLFEPAEQERQISQIFTGTFAPSGPELAQAGEAMNVIKQEAGRGYEDLANRALAQTIRNITQETEARGSETRRELSQTGVWLREKVTKTNFFDIYRDAIYNGAETSEYIDRKEYIENELQKIGSLLYGESSNKSKQRAYDMAEDLIDYIDRFKNDVGSDKENSVNFMLDKMKHTFTEIGITIE